MEGLRMVLKQNINYVGEKKNKREEQKIYEFSKPAGKLTAPPIFQGENSPMDDFLRD